MADWATISALATAGGTLVLAVATFASVRSANRSARTAERALLVGMRPLLFPSRLDDPSLKVMWYDQHWVTLAGGGASAEVTEGAIYLAMSLRNAGTGTAVLQGWYAWPSREALVQEQPPVEQFRRLTRDLYLAPNDIGFWQGAIRDRSDALFTEMAAPIRNRTIIAVDVLYTDGEGGQRTISRFSMIPAGDADWLCTVGRHWYVDQPGPR